MRFKAAATLAALALFALSPAHARARQQEQKDEKIIDDFVTTRGFIIEVAKPASKPKAGTKRRPAAVAKAKPSGGAKPNGGASAAGSSEVASQKPLPDGQQSYASVTKAGAADEGVQIIQASTLPPLGLGYSVYVRDEASGGLLPAPAGRSYRSGDAIVMVMETNSDGYLYVFNAENGKDPVMIYPDARLHGGANEVRAHVRETYPDDPELPFKFDDRPANEHLYIVLSREPIAGVPAGEALRKYCGKNVDECEWRPTAAQWARISAASLDRGVRQATAIAQADTQPVMPVTLQRGIRVKKDAPKPMTVRVADMPGAKMLVTKIELLHK